MTADDYWKALCEKNPSLKDKEVVRMRTSGVERVVRQAFERGATSGGRGNPFGDNPKMKPFNDIFGGFQ